MAKTEDILIDYLSDKDKKVFEDIHLFENGFAQSSADRELMGWYTRKSLRVAFYYQPSWWSRQKMYWIHGWKWEPKNKE